MKKQSGFSLIEIMVVIGVLTIIISFSLVMDLSAFKGDIFTAERATIVSALERARSQAMANVHESAYGVCFIPPNYVIFRESAGSCVAGEPTNELIPAHPSITVTFPLVVFSQLAGTTAGATINITAGAKTAQIIINNEGAINW